VSQPAGLPIETERLLLRPKTLGDLPFMHRLLSDAAVMRYIGDGRPRSLEQVREGLLKHIEHQREYGFSLWRHSGEPVLPQTKPGLAPRPRNPPRR
jgi:RimJ/RimL family protein N-acetyltransferase